MRLSLLLFTVLIICGNLSAQSDETIFSNSNLRITGAWGGPSVTFVRLGDNFSNLSGGFGGLEFNKAFFVGWSGRRLTNDRIDLGDDTAELDFQFSGPLFGYAYRAYNAIHPRGSVLLGFGNYELDNRDDDRIVVIQPMVGVDINVFQWFRIGLEGGYQVTSGVSSAVPDFGNDALSGLLGSIRLQFGYSWGR